MPELPGRVPVGQNRETRDAPVRVTVLKPVVITVHAVIEVPVGFALNFDMDQNPGFDSATGKHFDQLVGVPAPGFGVSDDLLQFGIEKFVGPGPIDFGMGVGKQQRHELRKIIFEHLFPGRIEVVRRIG